MPINHFKMSHTVRITTKVEYSPVQVNLFDKIEKRNKWQVKIWGIACVLVTNLITKIVEMFFYD